MNKQISKMGSYIGFQEKELPWSLRNGNLLVGLIEWLCAFISPSWDTLQNADTTFKAEDYPRAGQRCQGVLGDWGRMPDVGWWEAVGGDGGDAAMVRLKPSPGHLPSLIGKRAPHPSWYSMGVHSPASNSLGKGDGLWWAEGSPGTVVLE